ncbi:MAG: FAD-dependent thymidylate synthase [Bacteroidales bacterium]|nr:FAD-dependent thymidylate synthase [Bacteroidales bacterium]
MPNKPKVQMLTCTENPLEVMAYAWDVMKKNVPDTLEEYIHENDPTPANPDSRRKTQEHFEEKFLEIFHDGLGTPAEYVTMSFVFKNVSRALQQQLTRYRVGTSFSIQSLRRVDVGNFATNRAYYIPSEIKRNEKALTEFNLGMLQIQAKYNELLALGISVDSARGVLPLNIYSTITMSVSLRSLANIVKQRTCTHAQEEWREVIRQLKREVSRGISEVVAEELFKAPCEKTGICEYPDRCCGRVEGKAPVYCSVCKEPLADGRAISRVYGKGEEKAYCERCAAVLDKLTPCTTCGRLLEKEDIFEVCSEKYGALPYCQKCGVNAWGSSVEEEEDV